MRLRPEHIEALEEIRGKLSDIIDELLPGLPTGRDVERLRDALNEASSWTDALIQRGKTEGTTDRSNE